jgi:hypothetical protein
MQKSDMTRKDVTQSDDSAWEKRDRVKRGLAVEVDEVADHGAGEAAH